MDHGDHVDHMHGMMGLDCMGRPVGHGAGTYVGHVLPGILFVVWGGWWTCNACLRAAVSHSGGFTSLSWYKMPVKGMGLGEPVLKIVLPLIALSMELYFDHLDEGFQYLHCPKGTPREGEFAGDNINNWQHASSYPAVIASGIVDLMSCIVEFPRGLTHAFSALVFGIMAFLMAVHEKHEALDKMVHWLLSISMCLAFVFIVMEIKARHSPIVSMGKGVCTTFVGAWLIHIGRAMYLDIPSWSRSKDIAAALAPVYFCMILLLISLAATFLYIVLLILAKRRVLPAALIPDMTIHTNLGDPAGKRALELAERKTLLFTPKFDNDSALCSNEGSPHYSGPGIRAAFNAHRQTPSDIDI